MSKDAQRILQRLKTNRAALKRFGVRRIGLFGSAVRGTMTARSDIDFVVEFRRKSFDGYMELKDFLEELFARKIDLVLLDAIKPSLREPILSQVIYATRS